jgi:hypothetical protein
VSDKKEDNKGWRIDLFFVDSETYRQHVLDAEILPDLTTWEHGDHCPVTLTLSVPETKLERWPTPKEALSRHREEKMGVSEALARALSAGKGGEGSLEVPRARAVEARVAEVPVPPRAGMQAAKSMPIIDLSDDEDLNPIEPSKSEPFHIHSDSAEEEEEYENDSQSFRNSQENLPHAPAARPAQQLISADRLALPLTRPSNQGMSHYKGPENFTKMWTKEEKEARWKDLMAMGIPPPPSKRR